MAETTSNTAPSTATNQRYRNACWTSFLNEQMPTWDPAVMRYMIYQKEKCPTTGRFHWQGYTEFLGQHTRKKIQALIGMADAHIEKRRGSAQEAADYCRKSETSIAGPWEFGQISRPGKRTDILEVKADLDAGASLADIADNHFGLFCRYNKAFELYKNLKAPARTSPPSVYYLWGAPGTGKTRFVMDNHGEELWSYFGSWPYCDGYGGQKVVLFDDFDLDCYKKIGRASWLKIIDRYRISVQVKGSYVNWNPSLIYITSNYPPSVVFGDDQACHRRITRVCCYDIEGEKMTQPVVEEL